MRLGQLARQLDIKPEQIVKYLETKKEISISAHPNSKIDDAFIDELTQHFTPTVKEVANEIPAPAKKEPKPLPSEEPAPKAQKIDPDLIPDNPEHIETQKTELAGPKIIGKIDLPDKKDIQVEIDGVVYDQEFLDKKKKDELEERRQQKAVEKEQARKEAEEKKRKEREQRIVEQERRAMLEREKHNVLSAEEEKKKELILKAQLERERKLEEKRKRRQKEHYAKNHKVKANTSKKKKPVKETETPVQQLEQPKETNPIKRFIKWLNT